VGGQRARPGWAPSDPSVTATKTDSGYRIDGTKDRVEAGAQSGLLLVVARCGDEIRQLLVEADAPGVQVVPQQSVDLVKQYAQVHFDGVVVPSSAIVGSAAETPALIDRQSQIAQVLQCAEVVGILQTVFDFTAQWALDRHTFGRPLASYQALKHGFADMKLWLKHAVPQRPRPLPTSPRAHRGGLVREHRQVLRREMAGRLVQACVQMHGGIGVTWSMTCTCICVGLHCTAPCSARRRNTTYGCTRRRERLVRRNDD